MPVKQFNQPSVFRRLDLDQLAKRKVNAVVSELDKPGAIYEKHRGQLTDLGLWVQGNGVVTGIAHRVKTFRRNKQIVGSLAIATSKVAQKVHWFNLIYYPAKEHIEAFTKAGENTWPGGPSQYYPGATGVLNARLDLSKKQNPRLFVNYIQATVKSGEGIKRGLVTQYGGWRGKTLQMLFAIADKYKTTVIIDFPNPELTGSRVVKRQNHRLHAFIEAAKNAGYEVQNTGHPEPHIEELVRYVATKSLIDTRGQA